MWEIGFKKYLSEILEEFLGEVSSSWTRQSTKHKLTLSKKNEDEVLIKLSEGDLEHQIEMTYEEMYEILVPNHKMDYLYLFQDVLDELKEEDSKEMMVQSYVDQLIQTMSKVFMNIKDEMEVVKKEIEITPGVRFINHGIEYEQMALAI